MKIILVELCIICLLFIANGVFAMAELAVVSARRVRLKQLALAGQASAGIALALADAPNRFLPAVQTGITLVGLLAGAFGGATIAEEIADALEKTARFAPYAEAIGVAIVVVILTFLSLVIGELVPKRIALAYPERIACWVARPVDWLSRLTRPVIRLLAWATDAVLWLLRVRERRPETVTEDEVKLMMEEGVDAGVFDRAEPRMVESVLAFDARPVSDIMTPREKLVFLRQDDPHEAVWHKIVVSGHSSFPVYADRRDLVVGIVSVKSIYANLAQNLPVRLPDLMVKPLMVAASESVSRLLEHFKQNGRNNALVQGPDGRIIGMVTLVDVLEAIVGKIPSREERLKPRILRRNDGTLLVDGDVPMAQLGNVLGVADAPLHAKTVGAMAADRLGGALQEGARFDCCGWSAEIIDMDGQRVDKVLLLPRPDAARSGQGPAS